jgi:hypothetical protein
VGPQYLNVLAEFIRTFGRFIRTHRMLEVAQQHISKAKRLQKAGSLDEAFDNYQSALGGLLELYKVEQDAKRKVELGAFIEVLSRIFGQLDSVSLHGRMIGHWLRFDVREYLYLILLIKIKYYHQAYMVEAEGLKEQIKTSKTSSSTSGTTTTEVEALKEKMKTLKTSSSTSGTTISSMLFGARKSVSKAASSAPAAIPSDSFDYTAESRLKRSEATPAERRESSGSGASRSSGAKSSTNSPTVRRTSVGASANESAKDSSAPKKAPPPLSEYEKQIMSGTSSYCSCIVCLKSHTSE